MVPSNVFNLNCGFIYSLPWFCQKGGVVKISALWLCRGCTVVARQLHRGQPVVKQTVVHSMQMCGA